MAVELLANLAASTLAADITTTGATTLTVASAASFPAAVTGTSQFRVIVGTEVMIVTNVSGTTFTVTRGAEGTTAATHTTGDAITHVVTAATLAEIGVPAGAGGAGKVLTSGSADYAQAWTTPVQGPRQLLNRNTGTFDLNYQLPGWMGISGGLINAAGSALTAGTMYYTPIYIARTTVLDRIAVIVSSAGVTSSFVRLGIYTADSSTLNASSLVVDCGTVTVDATGLRTITTTQSLATGWYWLACLASASVTCKCPSTTIAPPLSLSDTAGDGGMAVIPESTGQSAASALPSTAPAIVWPHSTVARSAPFVRIDRAAN